LRAILDNGAGPNLIPEEVLTENWERCRIADTPAYKIVGAGGHRLNQKCFVTLFVKFGNLRMKARFVVVAGLAADCILGCQFIELHVKNILARKKRVTPMDDSVVSILEDSEDLPEIRKEEPKAPPVTKIRVAKFTSVPARTESTVWVQCAAPGLRFLQAVQRGNTLGTYIANGVAEILPMQPFAVRVVNLSDRERKIPKGMILGHALPHPLGIFAVTELEKSPLLPGQYALTKNPPPLPDRPDVDGPNWREDVDLNQLTPQRRERVFRVLGKHLSMWDGRLGHAHATSHRIDLIPGAKLVHVRPYRAYNRSPEAESTEVLRMLRAGVIEPANSEWASHVVIVPKPDGSMRFYIDYRCLNALTIRDSYPLPRMDECIDSLGDAKFFSTLDCNS
jgi:hypothetical protein